MIADTVDAFAVLIDGALPDPWSVNVGAVDAAAPPVVWVTASGGRPDTARPAWSVTVLAQVIPDAGLAGWAQRAAWDAVELIVAALDAQTVLTVDEWAATAATDQVGGATQPVVALTATFTVPTC